MATLTGHIERNGMTFHGRGDGAVEVRGCEEGEGPNPHTSIICLARHDYPYSNLAFIGLEALTKSVG
jgi:hypothetical protein